MTKIFRESDLEFSDFSAIDDVDLDDFDDESLLDVLAYVDDDDYDDEEDLMLADSSWP